MRQLIHFLFFLLISNFSYSQDWTRELDSVLNIIERNELFHGQVLIAEKGEIVFHKAFGNIPEKNESISKSTPLAVKSVTKAFTAAAILNLEQEAKLDLSDEVKDYFPEWPYKGITIKHLLSMTSGLPNFIEKAVSEADTTKFMENLDIVNFVSRHPVSVKTPGENYNYQNSNFITLAALVEKVSGMPYEDYVEKRIFEPLGLQNTYFEDLTEISKEVDGNSFYAPSGDGNLYSTAQDLYRLEQSYKTNKILSEKNIKSTFTKTLLNDGSLNKYGLAWWVIDEADPVEYYIIGDGPNIRASIQRYPESNSTLIFIHNFSGRYWEEVYWVVRNIWLGNDYKVPEKKKELKPYAIDINLYENYVGSYLLPRFGLLHVTEENGKLYLRPDPVPGKEELVPSSDTTFYFKDQSMEWQFYLDAEGKVKGFGFKGDPNTMGEKQ